MSSVALARLAKMRASSTMFSICSSSGKSEYLRKVLHIRSNPNSSRLRFMVSTRPSEYTRRISFFSIVWVTVSKWTGKSAIPITPVSSVFPL